MKQKTVTPTTGLILSPFFYPFQTTSTKWRGVAPFISLMQITQLQLCSRE